MSGQPGRDGVRWLTGDACQILSTLPGESVDCVVTSPPYWGLRDYGIGGQYGLEPTIGEYVASLRRVFAQLHRVLVPPGTVWLNLGDCYTSTTHTGRRDATRHRPGHGGRHYPSLIPQAPRPLRLAHPLPAKNLIGVPWRVAWALQDDGWILRNAIVWHKPNAMPESVRDRLSSRYELLFLLVKQARYHFDLDAIRKPHTRPDVPTKPLTARAKNAGKHPHTAAIPPGGTPQSINLTNRRATHSQGSNPGDVWTVPTRPYAGAHFATFPIDIPLRCIAAGCPPQGVVCDPFSGAGTTVLAARQLNRQAIAIDINPDYHNIAAQRLARHLAQLPASETYAPGTPP